MELLDTAYFLGPCNCLGVALLPSAGDGDGDGDGTILFLVHTLYFPLGSREEGYCRVHSHGKARSVPVRSGPLNFIVPFTLPYRLQHFLSNHYLIRSGQVIGLKKDIYLLMSRGKGMP